MKNVSSEHIEAVNRRRHVILNYDAVAFCMPHLEGDEMVDSMLASADLKNSPIDSIFWNWGEGNFAPYKSKILEPLNVARFPQWAKEGYDIISECHEATKRRGLESFFSYRINGSDTDRFENGHHCIDVPKFKEAHPACLIYGEWSQKGLATPKYDFAHKEIRDHKIAILAEVFDLYDFDGIEIDYARACPVLMPGHQWENRKNLTQFMSALREMLQAKAKKRGHPILIAARIPATSSGCRCDGIDIEEWVRQHCVDILTLGSRSYEIEYRFFNKLVQNRNVKCYPCIDEIHATDGYRNPSLEVFRGVYTNWFHQGFDGIETFNWQNDDPRLPTGLGEKTDAWLNSQWIRHKRVYEEWGKGIANLKKTFVIQRRLGGHFHDFHSLPWNWKTPRESWINSNIEAQLPAKLHADEDQDVFLHLYVGVDPQCITLAELRIQLSENENIEMRLNGFLFAYSDSSDKDWYDYTIRPAQLSEGDNLIQVSVSHSLSDCNVWIEKVELEIVPCEEK